MKVLVIGSGAREHALCAAIDKCRPMLSTLFCLPGNPGIAELATCVSLSLHSDEVWKIVEFVKNEHIDLVVIGPEAPLVDGLVDHLEKVGVACVGPNKEMAQLEGSKYFTKTLCDKLGIPTAKWKKYDDAYSAAWHLTRQETQYPLVIKANGLAAGKGVIIAQDQKEAFYAIMRIMIRHEFGVEAGESVIIEEFLQGTEMSYFVLSDGKYVIPFGTAQDYKKLLNDDLGPNTGGMGAVSPAPVMTDALDAEILQKIILPTVKETGFKGILYAGLMITADGPKLIEYNVRFGDPECQAILGRLDSDILPILYAAAKGDVLSMITKMQWSDRKTLVVTMAAPGYPDAPQAGSEIKIDGLHGAIFHAGTKLNDGKLVAAGGRVLTAFGSGDTYEEARQNAYRVVFEDIHWPEAVYRTDIGISSLTKRTFR